MDKSGHDASHSRYRAHSPSEDLDQRKFSRRPSRPESPPTKRAKLDSTAKSLAAELFSIRQILGKDEVQYVANKAHVEVQCVQDYNDILIGTVRSMYVAPRSSTKGQQYSWWDKETVEKMEEPEEDVHELIRESIRWQMDLVEQLGPLTDHLGKGVKDADSVDAVVNLCLKLPKSIVCRLQLIRFLANTTEPSAYEAVKRDKRMAEALFSWCSAAAMDKVTTILAEGLALIHSLDFFPRLLHAEWQRRLIEDWMDHIDFRVRRAAEDNLWKKS